MGRTFTFASILSKTNDEISSQVYDILHLRYPDVIGGNSDLGFNIKNEDEEGEFLSTNELMVKVLNRSETRMG